MIKEKKQKGRNNNERWMYCECGKEVDVNKFTRCPNCKISFDFKGKNVNLKGKAIITEKEADKSFFPNKAAREKDRKEAEKMIRNGWLFVNGVK